MIKILFPLLLLGGSLEARQFNSRDIGLVGGWHLNEGSGVDVFDASQYSTTATITNAMWVGGKWGTALFVDGNGDDFHTGTNPPALDITTNQITLAAWVKAQPTVPSYGRIITKHCCATHTPPYLRYNLCWNYGGNGKPAFGLSIGGNLKELAAASVTTSGKWYFLVGTYDGAIMKIWINGIFDNSMAASGNIDASIYPVYIGQHPYDGEDFAGIIDDPQIYSRTWSKGEIEYYYREGRASHGD